MTISDRDIALQRCVGEKSLGGAIDAATGFITSGGIHTLFDRVPGIESESGRTEYRCFYVYNKHISDTLFDTKVFLQSNTPSPDTHVQIAISTVILGDETEVIPDEITEPTGLTWVDADGETNAISIGDLPSFSYQAFWLKRVVNPGAASHPVDGVNIGVTGETLSGS